MGAAPSGAALAVALAGTLPPEPVTVAERLDLLAGGPELEALPAPCPLRDALAGLAPDVVLVDCPPGHAALDRLALAACIRSPRTPLDLDALETLSVPTLVVAGSRDDLAGDPQALADKIMGARAVRLPGCDHFSAIAHGLYKAAVFDFLDGVLED
jgi:pimeloyl-ACP methyl ester carboxylesterase